MIVIYVILHKNILSNRQKVIKVSRLRLVVKEVNELILTHMKLELLKIRYMINVYCNFKTPQ